MLQAIKSTILNEPVMVDVNHITFSGDLTDVDKTFITVSLTVKDENGDNFEDLGIVVEDIPNLQGLLMSFQNSVLPKIINKVEEDLGVIFI